MEDLEGDIIDDLYEKLGPSFRSWLSKLEALRLILLA
jgi:hypothetical protein